VGDELIALGGAFLAAGVLGRLGRRIGLPTIPLFMVAGILCGPHTPGIVLVDRPGDLGVVASIGLVLLLFYLGLEFTVRDLTEGGRGLLLVGGLYLLLNVGGGVGFGFALGWGSREALVIAGAIGISSSAIVTKLLIELNRLPNPETRLILGIIVVEDLFLALYLAILQPVISDDQGFVDGLASFGKAFAFLLAFAALARWGGRVVGRLVATDDDELLTICFVGLAVLSAGVAEEVGVSDAIGAFMIGLVLSESPVSQRIERLVLPLRDAFGALFFFAFGLTIDPGDVAEVAGPIAAAVALTLVLNLLAGALAARFSRLGRREAANIGTTILARGEFSLILVALAAAAGLDPRLGPFVAGYVLVLAIAGPLLASRSAAVARVVPAWLLGGSRPPEPTSTDRAVDP
jgi:monovalent cation:H+ antiporter-2, CPA2 family